MSIYLFIVFLNLFVKIIKNILKQREEQMKSKKDNDKYGNFYNTLSF